MWHHDWRRKKQLHAMHFTGTLIEAHCCAQVQIASYFGENEKIDTPESAYVILEPQIEVLKAATMRARIDKPLQIQVDTTWEIRRLVEHYRNFVLSVVASGVLRPKDAEQTLHVVSSITLKRVGFPPRGSAKRTWA